jgi:hypothetical protein
MSEQILVCPRCDCDGLELPALSRRDNKTNICNKCGNEEAMNDEQPVGTWRDSNGLDGLPQFGDALDRLIREKKFQTKIGVNFSSWHEWKKTGKWVEQ